MTPPPPAATPASLFLHIPASLACRTPQQQTTAASFCPLNPAATLHTSMMLQRDKTVALCRPSLTIVLQNFTSAAFSLTFAVYFTLVGCARQYWSATHSPKPSDLEEATCALCLVSVVCSHRIIPSSRCHPTPHRGWTSWTGTPLPSRSTPL